MDQRLPHWRLTAGFDQKGAVGEKGYLICRAIAVILAIWIS
jgi:hypothetical protein